MRSDGPYLFRRELFRPAELAAESFFLNFEFPIRVIAAGVRSSVVEIHCRQRLAGESKAANLGKVVNVARELVALRVQRTREWLRRR